MPKPPSLYSPLQDRSVWSGRNDAMDNDYLFQIIQFIDLDSVENITGPGYVILGFESDEGVRRNLGNVGAKEGPKSFREAASKLPVQQKITIYDAGNVSCIDSDLESAQTELKNRVKTILALGLMPIVIGGGHETAFGHYCGVSSHYSAENVAILNFDAHFDLRELDSKNRGNSGTPFRQISKELQSKSKPFHYYCAGIQPYANTKRLFDYANDNQVMYELAEKIISNPNDITWIKDIVKRHNNIYVSVCLDVFNSSIAPGVSAPQVLGIDAAYVIKALKFLKQSGCVRSFDIVELSPKYDIRQQTAKLAAALFFSYCFFSLN